MSSDDAKHREPANTPQSERNCETDHDDVREQDDEMREEIDQLQRVFALERLVDELS